MASGLVSRTAGILPRAPKHRPRARACPRAAARRGRRDRQGFRIRGRQGARGCTPDQQDKTQENARRTPTLFVPLLSAWSLGAISDDGYASVVARDTTSEAQAAQIAALRRLGPDGRLRLAVEMIRRPASMSDLQGLLERLVGSDRSAGHHRSGSACPGRPSRRSSMRRVERRGQALPLR